MEYKHECEDCGGTEFDVDEARAGDLGFRDHPAAVRLTHRLHQPLRHVARRLEVGPARLFERAVDGHRRVVLVVGALAVGHGDVHGRCRAGEGRLLRRLADRPHLAKDRLARGGLRRRRRRQRSGGAGWLGSRSRRRRRRRERVGHAQPVVERARGRSRR